MKLLTDKVGALFEDADGKLFIWTGNELRELKKKVMATPPPQPSGSLFSPEDLINKMYDNLMDKKKKSPAKRTRIVYIRLFIELSGKLRCWTSDWYLTQEQVPHEIYFRAWVGDTKTIDVPAIGEYARRGN